MEFRITTWNCFGMGQGLDAITANRAPLAPRFLDRDVIATCASPDVLCIQELLSRDAQVFFDGLKDHGLTASFRDDNRAHFRSATVRGTGLGIGARTALTKTRLENFRPPSAGWDRLARKGALYAQITLQGSLPLDILTVHLQAGYDAAAVAVRHAQLAHVKTLIDALGARDRPFIVCGDFNVDGLAAARRESEYARLEATLAGFEDLGAPRDLPTFHPHLEGNTLAHWFEPGGNPRRLDYIFFRRGVGAGQTFEYRSMDRILDSPLMFTPPQQQRNGLGLRAYASDHFGLRATFADSA